MISAFKAAGNPQLFLNNILSQNPQFNGVMAYIEENGGDAKKAFYKKAEELGIDPNVVLSQLK